MRNYRIALPLIGLLLSGCVETLQPSRERTGFISASTVSVGAGPIYALNFTGAFYRYDDLGTGIEPPETCQAYNYSTDPTPLASLPTMSAGPALYTLVSGRADTLFTSDALGFTTYELTSVNSVPHTPGDTLTVEIPGALDGFPATTLRVRTAEPFTHDPVGTAASESPLPLTWTAAPAPGSLMLFYLRFNASGTSDLPDTEIHCAFTDDGSAQIIPPYSTAWSNASAVSRSVVAQRVRQTRVEIDSKTRVTLLSFFDVPLITGLP